MDTLTAARFSGLAGGVALPDGGNFTGTSRAGPVAWFMAAIVSLGVAILIGLIGTVTVGSDTVLIWVPTLIAYLGVPIAVGFAVMRYRLFEIDRLVSRTIAYALITGILFIVFAVVNLSLQGALGSVVRGNAIAVAISTLVVW